MQRIYNVDQSIKDKLIIDTPVILGKRIANFDEYCLYFPTSRQLFYKHLKYSKESVLLSYLHTRYYDEVGNFWKKHKDEIEANETVYAQVINRNVRDDYSWKNFGCYLGAVYFDKNKLQCKRISQIASNSFEECFSSIIKHWSQGFVSIHSGHPAVYGEYHIKRIEKLKQLYNKIVFKDVIKDENLDVICSYDRVECITFDNFTIRILIGYFDITRSYLSIDVLSGNGLVSIESRKMLILAKVCARYPSIGKIIENLENNATTVLKNINEIKTLSNSYESNFRQQQFILRTVLHELKNKPETSTFTKNSLNFVALNSNSVQVLKAKFNKYGRLSYKKTTHVLQHNGTYKTYVGHEKTAFVEKDLDKLAEHMLLSGIMNFHDSEIFVEDYISLISGKSITFGHSMFRTTYANLLPRLKQYLDSTHMALIELYHNRELDEDFEKSEEPRQFEFTNYFDKRMQIENTDRFENMYEHRTVERIKYAANVFGKYIDRYKSMEFLISKLDNYKELIIENNSENSIQ